MGNLVVANFKLIRFSLFHRSFTWNTVIWHRQQIPMYKTFRQTLLAPHTDPFSMAALNICHARSALLNNDRLLNWAVDTKTKWATLSNGQLLPYWILYYRTANGEWRYRAKRRTHLLVTVVLAFPRVIGSGMINDTSSLLEDVHKAFRHENRTEIRLLLKKRS